MTGLRPSTRRDHSSASSGEITGIGEMMYEAYAVTSTAQGNTPLKEKAGKKLLQPGNIALECPERVC